MKNSIKRELFNDVVTGLMVAATFAAILPADALADLATVGTNSESNIMDPFVKFAGYTAYALGTILVVAGIAGCKKHADNPGQNPLAPQLGRLGAGGAFLIAPSVGQMLTSTGTAVGVSGTTTFTGFGQGN